MKKHILHHLKKFLRLGVAAALMISGTVNASAQSTNSVDLEFNHSQLSSSSFGKKLETADTFYIE